MPLSPSRSIRVVRRAVFCDGVDDYVKIEPFTVYEWSEITIEELIYPFHPKANVDWSKFSMIGDRHMGNPSTYIIPNPNAFDYTLLWVEWVVRTSIGIKLYRTDIFAYVNSWVHIVRRFTSAREISIWVNTEKKYSATIPLDEKTVLEWNPDTATYPERYKRIVLGANTAFAECMKVSYAYLRIYSRALTDSEILWNYKYPHNPVRNGLVLWLHAHPDNIKDIDNDGILEWIDLSGNNNHGKIYGATLVELIKPPAR